MASSSRKQDRYRYDESSPPKATIVQGWQYHMYASNGRYGNERYSYLGKDEDTGEPEFLDYGPKGREAREAWWKANDNGKSPPLSSPAKVANHQSFGEGGSATNECSGGELYNTVYGYGYPTNPQGHDDDDIDDTDDHCKWSNNDHDDPKNHKGDDADEPAYGLVIGHQFHCDDTDRYCYIGKDEVTGEPEFLDYGGASNDINNNDEPFVTYHDDSCSEDQDDQGYDNDDQEGYDHDDGDGQDDYGDYGYDCGGGYSSAGSYGGYSS